MKELFSFLDEASKVRLHTLLSQYISRHLKKQFPVPTVEMFNEVNRTEFAKEILRKNGQSTTFLIHKYKYKTTRTYTESEFFEDIVQYIDLKIPLYYYRQTMLHPKDDWIRFKKSYKGIRMFPGLKFKYHQNIEREKHWIQHTLLCRDAKDHTNSQSRHDPLIQLELKPIVEPGSKANQKQIRVIQNLCRKMGIAITNLHVLKKNTASALMGNLSRGIIYAPLFQEKNLDLAFANLQKVADTGDSRRRGDFEANLLFLEQRKHAYTNLNKANTKSVLVRPLLRMLGYDTENPTEVYEEFPCGNQLIDFSIMKDGKPFILIVVSSEKRGFEDRYQTVLNKAPSAAYIIRTNGSEYLIYGIKEGKEIYYLDSATLSVNNHNVPLLQSFAKESIFKEDEPRLLVHLKEEANRILQIGQVKSMIKSPPKELLDVFTKQGISKGSVMSVFHKAINEFSQECK
ncbi:hypothetical protein [Paenibacillus polymyxa]|uniref:Type I restriction enzyme R protein N-terminal domain-containing protein n=1 Tax=Paenibacillus polymyxa (strain SC2) TaxID=886882 RepID=E3EJQ3_PAEPS|nr:hypothetical protein [Paenibacillus polymyxa]ADO59651.1 hypothetical protein PPSC2_26890 [Paenibacillus polymyxa SC2]WPQ59525.1 type I restriction endonuclease subunit R [Paenibacillus polymyxa]